MSKRDDNSDNNDRWDEPAKQVTDEEGTVDQKVKNRILNARERVDEREDDIFIGAPLSPEINHSAGDLIQMWATSVRQYLKTIEPLLRSDEIEGSDYYYHEVEIAHEKIQPPDGDAIIDDPDKETPYAKEIRWSRLYRDDLEMRRVIDNPNTLFKIGFEPPEKREIALYGLKDVIEKHEFELQWHVDLEPDQIYSKTAEVYDRQPLRREWLETAVRKADEFLQDCAGVGLDIGHQSTDDQDENTF